MIGTLIENIAKKQNPTVVGLDVTVDNIPREIVLRAVAKYGRTFRMAREAIVEYNKGLIDSFADLVPAVKPQSAFYEMYGAEGHMALCETIEYAKSAGLSVILDVKRNDIGNTCGAYAKAFFGKAQLYDFDLPAMDVDSVTVNPYLGTDGISPFTDYEDKYIFALVKTSNASSGELQNIPMADGRPFYHAVADMVKKWGSETKQCYGYNAVGAVVGATYPKELSELRAAMPNTFFLIPGYGAQGGKAADIMSAFDERGLGAIVNSSRGIIYAYKKHDDSENYKKYARQAVIDMKNDLTSGIGTIKI